jgi:ribosomal protein S18 acetylase RimI-like enzyme
MQTIEIRLAAADDHDAIWGIISEVIRTGDTYVFPPDSDREEMLAYWCGEDKHTYVAEMDKRVLGTFIIKDNFPGLGSHVANASYMTLPEASGRGIGRAMGAFSLEEARLLGYKAMQFNIVVKSNDRAVRLWQGLGFEIVGEVPDAFRHLEKGYTNAYIMWKRL